MNRFVVTLALAALSSCGSDGDEPLPREVMDCTADDAVCDRHPDTGCSVELVLVDEDGQVVGICGGGDDNRACSKHCETDGDCPEGWTCLLPDRCPGDNTVRYCVPTQTELALQELPDCRALANPRVCGFF